MRCRQLGKKASEETKQKISNALKRAANRPEAKTRVREVHVGKKVSGETRQKLSEALKQSFTPERRMRVSEVHKGKIVSEESRKKMSDSAIAAWARRKDATQSSTENKDGVTRLEDGKRRE